MTKQTTGVTIGLPPPKAGAQAIAIDGAIQINKAGATKRAKKPDRRLEIIVF